MKYLFIALYSILFYSSVTFAGAETTSSTVTIPSPPTSNGSQPNESTTITTTITSSNAPSAADEAVISAVYAKFSKTPALIGTALTVTSQNKVATISGTVTAQSQADAAIEAAATVVGKENVRSNIKVTTNPDFNKQPSVTPNY